MNISDFDTVGGFTRTLDALHNLCKSTTDVLDDQQVCSNDASKVNTDELSGPPESSVQLSSSPRIT